MYHIVFETFRKQAKIYSVDEALFSVPFDIQMNLINRLLIKDRK